MTLSRRKFLLGTAAVAAAAALPAAVAAEPAPMFTGNIGVWYGITFRDDAADSLRYVIDEVRERKQKPVEIAGEDFFAVVGHPSLNAQLRALM